MPDPVPAAPTRVRLNSLTGLRAIAAVFVFGFHASFGTRYIDGATGDALYSVVAKAGFMCLCFFFILSGFVLTWSARPAEGTVDIWRRRAAKVYPNHVVTFVAAAVLMAIAAESIDGSRAVENLFLIQAWFPDMPTTNSMNGVSWSLSCEAFFYLMYPLLLRGVRAIPAQRLWAVTTAVVALAVAAPFVSQFAISDQPKLPFIDHGQYSFHQIWFVYFFPPVRALEFVLGMLLARLLQTGRWPRIGLLPAGAVAVAGYFVTTHLPYLFGIGGPAVLWLSPLIAAAAVADRDRTRSPFRGRTLVKLGELSFAFYLVHGLVLTYGYRWVLDGHARSAPTGIPLALAAAALSLALAWALFNLVENPFLRRFGRARPTPGEHAAGGSTAGGLNRVPQVRPATAAPASLPLEVNP
ncbi:acyltransferase [Frankia sp. AiPs1]|uniref:acyltransferase family protein n=1 Tax=Frankia sp. AiPs1 TaxID=573493 RepID=UPI002042F994|nr:acyltransferase [Frankia sp. AiPs1]MCM3924605.1 acyltransferase [Frankia sp. AiPs1]